MMDERSTAGPRLGPLFLAVFLALGTLAAPAAPAAEENVCQVELEKANEDFAAGRFEELLETLERCLEKGPAEPEKILVYELRAKTYLALDDLEQTDLALSTLLDLRPTYEGKRGSDSPRYLARLAKLRGGGGGVRVSSVSKTEESLREAPATVVVVTAEEIARRGYTDLEQVLHDLPGFDISRTNGATHSNVYQRGYRSVETNRTLVLVDGVEENDLWSSTIYLSRQYPLSIVDRIEVIYGPASTMYGPNALAGVINVVTKRPAALLPDGKRLAVSADAVVGSFGTRSLEVTLAGRGADLNWAVTTRSYESDEFDLGTFPDWDYDPSDLEVLDYAGNLAIGGATGAQAFAGTLRENGIADCTGEDGCLFAIDRGASGEAVAVRPTGAALDLALARDQRSYAVDFTDPTRDFYVHGRLDTTHLEVGFQLWRRDEAGASWFGDILTADDFDAPNPGPEGQSWIPQQTWLYLRYFRRLRPDLKLELFTRYKEHELASPSLLEFWNGFGTGGLGLADLVLAEAGKEAPAPGYVGDYYHLSNNQLRAEASVVYEPSSRFSLVSGLELRDSALQGDYVISPDPHPSETGQPGGVVFGPRGERMPRVPPPLGGNTFAGRDLGLYAQASYKVFEEKLKFVFGGRLDNNEVRDTLGYGTVFNPRLGVIYLPGDGDFVFKAIYASAFQGASNFQKFATSGSRRVRNPEIDPEEVDNVEISASWKHPKKDLSVDVAAYEASYSGIPAVVPCRPDIRTCDLDPTSDVFDNLGDRRVRGLQATFALRQGRFELHGNYTYTDPQELDLELGRYRRIGDIASHRVNLDVATRLKERFVLDLRFNWVGDRETEPTNLFFDEIDASFVTHATLTYDEVVPGLGLQLVIQNLFDEEYFDPGVRDADGIVFASRIPQPERAAYLRLRYSF